jgi:predicted amidohydrolase YtcJ
MDEHQDEPMTDSSVSTAFTFITALAITGCGFQDRKADLIVHNAHIVTLDSAEHVYEAMAIKDGRILELGPERQIMNRYAATKTYDAAGRTVYPGFIDGHCHFFGYGLNKQKIDLQGVKNWDEAVERTVAFAKAHPKTEWIMGRGWDQNLWEGKAFPDNTRLNELFPDRPVLLQRVDGHAAVVNQVAMDRVGLTAKSVIAGGILEMRNGKPTGLLVDNAVDVFQKIFDEADEATKRQALLDAQTDCFEKGLTMVCDAGLDVGTIELIKRMQEEGALKMRVYAMVADKSENLDHFAKTGAITTDRLWVRAVKVYGDGALGSRGALLKQPYADVDSVHFGLLLKDRPHMLEVATWCLAHNFQMATHCIGDSADRFMLDVYAEVLKGMNDKRWRIEHAQCMDPRDFHLFAENSIIPSVQPTHLLSDAPWAIDRIGAERFKSAYAWNTLRKQMGIVALSTDFPVEGIDPLATYYAAVVRKYRDGSTIVGSPEQEALSRKDALLGMTLWNALASFTESDLGSLEVGKRADMTIVDRDLLNADEVGLRKAKVMATVVNGEVVYE